MKIPFNKPYITGNEIAEIERAIARGQFSSNGYFNRLCSEWFEKQFGFARALPTNSCTSALEIAALLCGIGQGDEVIMPSFTFVSTALAFAKFGAVIRFVDALPDLPTMDCSQIEAQITPRTKAIVAVHYNGVPCDMDTIRHLATKHHLKVIEDAAHAINAPECGKWGDVVCYSFHETKNIHCGEGGLLGINTPRLVERGERIWLKGTNRNAFESGKTNRYEWVDLGGSYGLSELGAAFLWAQIASFRPIIARREAQWSRYFDNLRHSPFELPSKQGSSHIFYLVCRDKAERDSLMNYLATEGILAPFHYQALHTSPFGRQFAQRARLNNTRRFSTCLLRLPLYYELRDEQIDHISNLINQWRR